MAIKITPPNNKRTKCEVYSRICGYIRPTASWADHKQEEFKDRVTYDRKQKDG